MCHAQTVRRKNQLAAVSQSNRGRERPTVDEQRNKKDRAGAKELRLRGDLPRSIRFGYGFANRFLLTLDVACGFTRHLPIVSQTGEAANHQSDGSMPDRLQQTVLYPPVASLQSSRT